MNLTLNFDPPSSLGHIVPHSTSCWVLFFSELPPSQGIQADSGVLPEREACLHGEPEQRRCLHTGLGAQEDHDGSGWFWQHQETQTVNAGTVPQGVVLVPLSASFHCEKMLNYKEVCHNISSQWKLNNQGRPLDHCPSENNSEDLLNRECMWVNYSGCVLEKIKQLSYYCGDPWSHRGDRTFLQKSSKQALNGGKINFLLMKKKRKLLHHCLIKTRF